MNLWKRVVLARRRLSIFTKFTLAFVALLLLIIIVALTGFIALKAVRSETEAAIVTSIEVQRQVFKMDAALRNARQLERDFFLLWPTEGFSKAVQAYAEKHRNEINNVLDVSSNLQELLASANVSDALRQSNPDLVEYVGIVEQYSRNFNEAVRLVSELGIDDVGVIARLEQKSARLYDTIQLANDPSLMLSYWEMQTAEKAYLATRQAAKKQAMSEAAQRLRKRMVLSPNLDSIERNRILRYLDEYESVVQEIVRLNEEILSKIRDTIDIDAAKLYDKLLGLANAEIERARTAITQKIYTAALLLIAAVLIALSLAGAVAKQFASALRTVAIEKMKSEQLLLNILPEQIAQRLKQEERTIADYFSEVTVLFADIVGFTELASQTTPIELVEILNVIFSEFDQLAEEHGLEKIKTIGDAYMVVGGLPEENPNHAEAIAHMALDMQATIAQYCTETGTTLSIRIGINTGPVIAGIIGTKKFIYDLWGDTVNIASRMESHGIPGSIQVTEATYNRLQSRFIFEERGMVPVKGKGPMNCYLLKGQQNLSHFY